VNGLEAGSFGVTLLITGGALLVVMAVAFTVAIKTGKHSVVDTAWGIGLALAAVAAVASSIGHGQPARRYTLLAASVLWGLRLAAHVGWRNHGKGEDPPRHPNYFGDFCMWWGLFLISLGSWVELLFVFAPLLMTYILIRGTGQRMTDRRMTASRPQYADYVARTSGFVPLPPKRRPAHGR
jgi:steroid 5-alpha reductase family enzyme